MQQQVLKVKLVSRKEMIQRNKFLAFGLMDNPFLLLKVPDKQHSALSELENGVDLPTAESLIEGLYSKEASEIIIKDLRKGKDTFIITWRNGEGDVRSASSLAIKATGGQDVTKK